MSTENPIKVTIDKLRKAVESENFPNFAREHVRIVNFCRRALFHGDREALGRWYPELSSLLIWFYRSGKAAWPDAERSMGGIELLFSLVGNFLETRTLHETLAEVKRSGVDREILKIMSQSQGGIRSGDLAEQLGKSQNSVTNRLPALERMGLIVRSRIGRNSVVYLTPKGRGTAEDLQREGSPEACNLFAADRSAVLQPYTDLTGQNRPPDKIMEFWFLLPVDRPQGQTINALSTCSRKRIFH